MSVRRTRAAEVRRRAARRRRRQRRRRVAIITAAVTAGLILLLALLAAVTGQRTDAACLDRPDTFPSGVQGWRGEQLENAAIIIGTAREMGLDRDAQILGVMAAMGESSLRNIDYGDWETSGVTNPDGSRTSSIGLFQQQQWWGTVEERMDPATAAGKFFARLTRVRGWQDLPASQAIHRVQINADPEHYARFADDAAAVVDALSGPCPAPTG